MNRRRHTIPTLALKELRDGIRNRWIAATIILLGTLALVLSFLGSAPSGELKVAALEVSVVSLTSLSMYLIPLIALMLAFDALVGEFENGTMLLLLTYPVRRWQIIAGKFVGHSTIMLLAILIGYGTTMAVLIFTNDGDTSGWQAYLAMMASSLLLGCAFLTVGYLISSLVRERSVATGLAVATWLLLVVFYDLGLLSALMLDEGKYISEGLFTTLMLANPADAYRLFNFTGITEVANLVGASEIKVGLAAPLLSMLLWIVVPFLLAVIRFQKREV
ncbi:MAG: ABC transporter permease [Xanthomonadales bacterium]|nr:ABC transporter permease [Xanthomonadales bacterium]